MITGLSFGPLLKCDQKSSRIKDVYFKGENKVRNDELEKVFLFLWKLKKEEKEEKYEWIQKQKCGKVGAFILCRACFFLKRMENFNRYAVSCSYW